MSVFPEPHVAKVVVDAMTTATTASEEKEEEIVVHGLEPASGTGDCHLCGDADDVLLDTDACSLMLLQLQQCMVHATSQLSPWCDVQMPRPPDDAIDASGASSVEAVAASDEGKKSGCDISIIRQTFTHHPLLHHLDDATTTILIGRMELEELAPGMTIAASRHSSSSSAVVILCGGSLHTTRSGDSTTTSYTSQTTSLLLQMPSDCFYSRLQEHDMSHNEEGKKRRNSSVEACAKHVPENVFSANPLYAMLPLHAVTAGDDGATVCVLPMHCFKCVLAHLCLEKHAKLLPLSPVTELLSDKAPHGSDDMPDLLSASFTEMSADEAQELQRRAHDKTRRHAVVGESVPCSNTFRPRLVDKTLEERAALQQMVRRHPLFASLRESHLRFIVDAFKRRVFEPGEPIASEDGELSHEFHWVERGVVEAVNNNNSSSSSGNGGGTASPLVWRSGDCFCTERLLYMYNARVDDDTLRRSALDQRGDDCAVLWTIPRTVLKRTIMTFVLRERHRLLNLVYGVGLFCSLSRHERLQLIDALEPVAYATGCYLLQQGATTDCIILIDTGTVEVTYTTQRGVAAHARFIGRNSCVGAGELLSSLASPFDYVAHSQITAFRLHHGIMTRMFGDSILERLATTPCGRQEVEWLQVKLETLMPGELDHCDAASDSQSEREYTDDMYPVEMKNPEDDIFLHRFLSFTAYGSASSMQRGLAVAAFEPLEHLPYGCVLHAANASEAETGTTRQKQQQQQRQQYLYVISDGVVTLSQGGNMIARYGRGQSIGEEVLLQKRHTTPVTTAVVTSPSCAVYKLDRKTFRSLLMKAYLERLRASRVLLNTMPFSSLLDNVVITALSRSARTMVFMPSEVVLPQGKEVCCVELLLEGAVDVALHGVAEGDSEETALRAVAALGPTDIIGAFDLLNRRPSVACYIARSRLRTLRIPAWLFSDTCLQNHAMVEYLTKLQAAARYSFLSV